VRLGECANMDLGFVKPTSEEITAAFLIALALFFVYLQLHRIARLTRDRHETGDQDRRDEQGQDHEEE
jgi:hypothetical protein